MRLALAVDMDASGVRQGVNETKGALSELDKAAESARQKATAVAGGNGVPELSTKAAAGIKLTAHETQNLARQLSDVGVSLASGQSPFMVMVQQGAQIQDVLGTRGVSGILSAVGQGIGSLITPATLALAGLTALGYGATAVFQAMRGEAISTEEVLSQHEDVIKRIRDAYGLAEDAARDYARESATILTGDARDNLADIKKRLREEVDEVRATFVGIFTNPLDPNQAINLTPDIEPFGRIFARLSEEADKARPSILGLREEIANIKNDASQPESVRDFADSLLEATDKAAELERALPGAEQAISAIGGAAAREAAMIREMTSAITDLTDIAKIPLTDRENAERIYRLGRSQASDREGAQEVEKAYQDAIRRIEQREADSRIPLPTARPNMEDHLAEEAKRLARGQGRDGRNPYQSLIASSDRRIEQLRTEISLIGSYGVEAERMRIENDLMSRATERGITLDDKQIGLIKEKAENLAPIADRTEASGLQRDLRFEEDCL